MEETDLDSLVIAAKQGDLRAFEGIVTRVQEWHTGLHMRGWVTIILPAMPLKWLSSRLGRNLA